MYYHSVACPHHFNQKILSAYCRDEQVIRLHHIDSSWNRCFHEIDKNASWIKVEDRLQDLGIQQQSFAS
jgi:hypothetical protein